jgi:hypothetical protein
VILTGENQEKVAYPTMLEVSTNGQVYAVSRFDMPMQEKLVALLRRVL